MRKIEVMARFYCFVCKIWKKNSILCCYKKGNKWFVLFFKESSDDYNVNTRR